MGNLKETIIEGIRNEIDCILSEIKEEKDKLKDSEIKDIITQCSCSKSTFYNYIGGKISNIHLGKAIIQSLKNIVENRKNNLNANRTTN